MGSSTTTVSSVTRRRGHGLLAPTPLLAFALVAACIGGPFGALLAGTISPLVMASIIWGLAFAIYAISAYARAHRPYSS